MEILILITVAVIMMISVGAVSRAARSDLVKGYVNMSIFIGGLVLATTMLLAFEATAQELQDNDSVEVIVLSGDVDKHMEAKLIKALEIYPNLKTVAVDSPGGYVHIGFRIGHLIRDNNLNTFIYRNGSCASACTYIFMGGRYRGMQYGGRLGFHPARAGGFPGGIPLNDILLDGQRLGIDAIEYFVQMSVASKMLAIVQFISKSYQNTHYNEMDWYQPQKENLATKSLLTSGVVTHLF